MNKLQQTYPDFFFKMFIASPVYLLHLDALSFYAISTVDFSIPKYLLYSSQNIYIGKLSIIHLADVLSFEPISNYFMIFAAKCI